MPNQDTDDLGLGDVFEASPSPPPPEPTIAYYDLDSPVEGSERGPRLTIRLVGSHPLWGHYLWNSGICLAKYLEHNPTLYAGSNVLELGAGGGLPALVTALRGAKKTVISDYPDRALVENIEVNVERNVPEKERSEVAVLGYVWGADTTPLLSTISPSRYFDLVLLSDLIFNHSQHEALLKSCELLTDPHPQSDQPSVLVFYTHHRPHLAEKDLDFFRLAESRGWICDKFFVEQKEAMFADDPGDVVVRSTVHGWKLRRPI
ncbi:hypothetical protein DACRYDRAFT_96680 [Dacryopinax primogenitus]|uniref:Elongation factor methyltransferase 7 n=1 Tax=Dacryopinax primogenitus (strain DJM 731) TaxID=1858805 RepID=M5FNX2_DACPD|nr:uncharacterized protein DACRYDRAFT_96680 [Dacryopinax primogenitus]EJT98025.1 hypothetical protein DACRYDRAFT_96680 [Dacryopinax primogenitus]